MSETPIELKTIAKFVDGKIDGDPGILIHGISSITDAVAGDITFLSDKKYFEMATKTLASAIVVSEVNSKIQCSQIIVLNPHLAIANIIKKFYYTPPSSPAGNNESTYRGDQVKVGRDGTIGPFVTIEDYVQIGDRVTIFPGVFIGEKSIIGDDSLLYPNVTVREKSHIGKRVTIHSGTVIGSDGFGYIKNAEQHEKIPHIGHVVIEDDVEIGANVTIDRATLGKTVICKGTKIDNLVQVAHNVKIGENSLIVAQAGIAGSSTLGKNTILAGQAGVSDHVTIGENAVITAQTGVAKNVPAKQVVSGTPATSHTLWLRITQILQRLPEIRKHIRDIDRRIQKIENKESTQK